MEQAERWQQEMALSRQTAIAARLHRMAGRWFTPEHTWVALDGEVATVGITDHAYQMFSNILVVSLPRPGAALTAGGSCGQVEGSRAVSDLYANVGGTVTDVNPRLDSEPELINDDPYGDGWLFRLAVSPGTEASLRGRMLSPTEYEELTRMARLGGTVPGQRRFAVKRAERQRRERALEAHGRDEAEWLALKALLDHRIPDSERLVRAVKHPLFLDELSAGGAGPTGVTHATDVVRRYARIIAQRTGGDAQAVQQHFMQLIGKERAAELGVNPAKLKLTSQSAGGGGAIADVIGSGRDIVAVASYLVLPAHLNLGNLPPNPFGSPRVTALMKRMQALNYQAVRTSENTQGVGLNSAQLGHRVEKLAEVVAYEISRAIPSNEAREAALKAMRLSGCLETYTPQVVRQAGWRDIQVHDADPAIGHPTLETREIAVYDVSPGESGSPTRYRCVGARRAVVYGLLNLYAA